MNQIGWTMSKTCNIVDTVQYTSAVHCIVQGTQITVCVGTHHKKH